MREIQLLMQPDLVLATRRAIAPKTNTRRTRGLENPPADATCAGVFHAPGQPHHGEWQWTGGDPRDLDSMYVLGESFRCPYGMPGDRLWIREAWRAPREFDAMPPRDIPPGTPIWYEAQDEMPFHPSEFGKLRPSMFMPRWTCRQLLDIHWIQVERLQDISEADAIAEGAERLALVGSADPIFGHAPVPRRDERGTFRFGYQVLWESINGAGSWDLNPFVWSIHFTRVEADHG